MQKECAFACLIVDIHGKKKVFETFFPFSPALTGRGGVVYLSSSILTEHLEGY